MAPPMLGLMEVPESLEATLVFSPHTIPICGMGTVSSRSGGHNMGNVLPSVPAMVDKIRRSNREEIVNQIRTASET
ncbi:hypothetical protein LWI28_022043 [Acer negundo]|uniref:Uncharacterized protein n=1 Tax=Acer negundo TaxID=4023 RepID=A0AAD5JFW2_ACENE|nr:hypothetical protein LWI28_022043 [Acer negundo]